MNARGSNSAAGNPGAGTSGRDGKRENRGIFSRFHFYDPTPTLRALRTPLLAIFGELDTPDGVKANVSAITAALQGKEPLLTIKVFPNGRYNLMDIGGFEPGEYARLQRFVPGLFDTMADWLEKQARRRHVTRQRVR